jgi:hypothetical protein
MLKTIAIAVALFGGIAAPAVFQAKAAAGPRSDDKSIQSPSFQSQSSQSNSSASQSFAATCSADAKVDSRVEPVWVGQSFAGDGCSAPSLPRPVDGYTASQQQVLAGMAAQKKYVAQADVYQACIADFVAARRGKKPVNVAMTVIEDHRLAASQADEQKAADQVKITIAAFNEAGSEDCK